MNGIRVKFWEGRTPSPEYYAPVDPYREQPPCKYNLRELVRYARQVGKPITELTYEEVMQFAVTES